MRKSHIRIVSLGGGLNFRDLGGYIGDAGRIVRWGTVFRSGTTHLIDNEDRVCLEKLGLRTVFDLRSIHERAEQKHGLYGRADIAYLAAEHNHTSGDLLRVLKDPNCKTFQMQKFMENFYATLPYEFSAVYKALFDAILSRPLPLAINCAAGKDRTGVAAAMLLGILGVAWEDIVGDYLLSNEFTQDIKRMLGSGDSDETHEQLGEKAEPLYRAERSYVESAWRSMTARSGSFYDYVRRELQLTHGDILDLRERLLTPADECD